MDFKHSLYDTSRNAADILVNEIENNKVIFKKLYEFVMFQEKTYAMRASRVFALLSLKYPSLIQPYFLQIITDLENLKDKSIKRNFLQIFVKYYWHNDEETLGKLIDCCFKFILSSSEPIAVRAYSLTILYKISKKEPLIQPELISSLEILSSNDTTTMKNYSDKILSKLNSKK